MNTQNNKNAVGAQNNRNQNHNAQNEAEKSASRKQSERKSENKRRTAYLCVIGAVVLMLAAYEFFIGGRGKNAVVSSGVDAIITRILGSVAAALLVRYLGYRVTGKVPLRGLITALPCFIVALCNPPILSLIVKKSSLDVAGLPLAGYIILFAAECFFVALFEELLFRGAVFLTLLENRRANGKQIFVAVILSSAIFGLTHLLNLFSGFSGAVFLQVGYSFLLGGMCAFTLLCTKNIFCATAVHAVFNFCGQLVERFGHGEWATIGIMAFTVCLGVCTAAFVIFKFLRFSKADTLSFYTLPSRKNSSEN